jgi:hypothetical protein
MAFLVSANSIAAIDGKKEKKGSGTHHIHDHDKSCMFELLVVVMRRVSLEGGLRGPCFSRRFQNNIYSS